MPAAAETRIGRTDMPLRGMNPSYNIGSPATSIGRVVFASATWGRPRNPQARGKRGSPASILSVMRAASHHYVSFPARNGLDLETAQLALARPELSSTKTIAVRRGMNSLLTINSFADVALDTFNSLSARLSFSGSAFSYARLNAQIAAHRGLSHFMWIAKSPLPLRRSFPAGQRASLHPPGP